MAAMVGGTVHVDLQHGRHRPMNRVRRALLVATGWRSLLTATFALGLGACAPADAVGQESHQHRILGDGFVVADTVSKESHQHRIVGDGVVVRVIGVGDEVHAFPIAEQYCGAYAKTAQFKQIIKRRLSRYASTKDAEFHCVTARVPSSQT